MKGKRVIAGILLAGILAVTLAGCKNIDNTRKETEKPVITLGSDNYPPYNYLNEDGVPTGIDVELATEAFKRMGYQVDVVQINWEKKKELVESGEIDCIMGIAKTVSALRGASVIKYSSFDILIFLHKFLPFIRNHNRIFQNVSFKFRYAIIICSYSK